jgi:glycerol kinase
MYLAVDQGGHATRAAVYDACGRKISYVVVPVATTVKGKRHVEQDPEEIVASVRAAVRLAVRRARIRPGSILGAGLATQRSGAVCWDRNTGEPLSPVLNWQDRRCGAELETLSDRADAVREKTGLPLSPHYGAGKIRWCLDRIPSVRAAAASGSLACGPPASFLAFRLAAERPLAADPVSAGRTLLWNRHEFDWDPELLAWFRIPEEHLPECVPTRHRYGGIAVGGKTVPLNIVTGDQNAAVHASGRARTDTMYVNIGTGAFALRPFYHDPGIHPGLLTAVSRRDGRSVEHVLEGTVNGAAAALLWFQRRHRVHHFWHMLPECLEAHPEPPLFLNGVSGIGSPWWIPEFRSRFLAGGGPGARAAAVVESIVFLIRRNLELLAAPTPRVRRIRISGGLSLLDGLCARISDLSRLPVERLPSHEATLRGIARLVAGMPAGWRDPAGGGDRFKPRRNRSLEDRYRRWLEAMERAVRNPDR